MGMAAGQARLLSITSRMSDNELRAQIINNNKMRLASQSSQASEAYVTALNEAQMMFTNYDADNNTSYQKLTYNALTSYNPYNNQYIVTNASGNVLLSEKDAVNYKNANGDVEKFLQYYGLEKTTTYFDNLVAHAVEIKLADGSKKHAIEFKTGIIDGEGREQKGNVYAPGSDASAKGIAKYIQDLYEGNLTDEYPSGIDAEGKPIMSKLHPGYENAVSSEDYYNYTKLLGDYTLKKDAYIETVAQLMAEKLESMTISSGSSDKNLNTISAAISSARDINDMKNVFEDLKSFVNATKAYKIKDSDNYFTKLIGIIDANKTDRCTATYSKADGYCLKLDGAGTLVLYDGQSDSASKLYSFTKTTIPGGMQYGLTLFDKSGNAVGNKTSYNGTFTYGFASDGSFNGSASDETLSIDTNYFNSVPDNWEVKVTSDNDVDNMRSVANQIVSSLRQSIYSVWDPDCGQFKPNGTSSPGYVEYEAYKNAAKALSEQIFGVDVGETNYANLDNIEVCFNGSLKGNFQGDKRKDFQKIYDAYLLDCIMNTYGELKYAWISNGAPKNPRNELTNKSYNENGDAKAQWYQNLFERVQKGGYKVIQDGLASSNEWIQFAFESGIITMEQIDANKNWQPLIYSNCSDITEQTNDAAIAKAEAEYKAAMNKIENKDKRYDLELKNIDTEHNSLQTEYDSIKTAIDKNIERTFKLYS